MCAQVSMNYLYNSLRDANSNNADWQVNIDRPVVIRTVEISCNIRGHETIALYAFTQVILQLHRKVANNTRPKKPSIL